MALQRNLSHSSGACLRPYRLFSSSTVMGLPDLWEYVFVGRFMYIGRSIGASTKAFSTSMPLRIQLLAAAIVSTVQRDLYLAVGANVSS